MRWIDSTTHTWVVFILTTLTSPLIPLPSHGGSGEEIYFCGTISQGVAPGYYLPALQAFNSCEFVKSVSRPCIFALKNPRNLRNLRMNTLKTPKIRVSPRRIESRPRRNASRPCWNLSRPNGMQFAPVGTQLAPARFHLAPAGTGFAPERCRPP